MLSGHLCCRRCKKLFLGSDRAFMEATKAHSKALQLDATENLDVGLLLIHAETILSSAETIRDLSSTIIELIKNI